MMGLFLFAATVLILATLLLLLRPWRRPDAPGHSAQHVAAAIFRDQLAELDRDLAAGTLAASDHAQARDELQRRLLQEAGTDATAAPPSTASGLATLLIAVALPVAATGLYGLLGAPESLLPPAPAVEAAVSPDVERMVAGLAARLEQNPDDPKGWAMLARSYQVMGRHAQAQAAWARAGVQAP
jgi:cytochrome c-type biogenesis protein CcmH